MNLPIDTCENGSCSFAIRGEYDKRVYAKNIGLGGGHFPATSVCVVYQLRGRMRDNGSRPLPQGWSEQSDKGQFGFGNIQLYGMEKLTMNIDNDIRALILRELTEIREATIRRCGRTKPGRAERKVLAAAQRIEDVVR